MKEIKMYSDYKSPFAYLAFDPAFELEKKYRVRVRWIPFQLRVKGKGERSVYSEYKARYSYLDARRWAKPRGLIIRGRFFGVGVDYSRSMKPSRLRERPVWRSLRSALASICRIRSRVTANCLPTSSSV